MSNHQASINIIQENPLLQENGIEPVTSPQEHSLIPITTSKHQSSDQEKLQNMASPSHVKVGKIGWYLVNC
ncbi:hypothetical protein Pint_12296 [Pistacia integerrima]|uniref:Uncharacterized protein n=1 Tax=Pistacia integerrima TaxID=434235 RepID=A0ACC0XN63_9ROSI|nr:hypothetical protein Pint_12296 [Pistacia integerrima]